MITSPAWEGDSMVFYGEGQSMAQKGNSFWIPGLVRKERLPPAKVSFVSIWFSFSLHLT